MYICAFICWDYNYKMLGSIFLMRGLIQYRAESCEIIINPCDPASLFNRETELEKLDIMSPEVTDPDDEIRKEPKYPLAGHDTYSVLVLFF